jgi:hypothetical protein
MDTIWPLGFVLIAATSFGLARAADRGRAASDVLISTVVPGNASAAG